MKKVYLHFKSDNDFSLFINGEYVDVCQNQQSIDLIVSSDKLSFIFCPIIKRGLPITESGMIEVFSNKLKSSSENLKIVPLGNSHFIIYIVAKYINNVTKSRIINQKNIENKYIVVYNNFVGCIDIFKDSQIVEKTNLHTCIDVANIQEHGTIIIIECLLMSGKRYCVLVDKQGKIVFQKECDSVEYNNSEIKIMCIVDNLLGIAKIYTYLLDSGNLEDYCIYINKGRKVTDNKIVPYAFLCAIQAGGYNLAKSYLSDNLANVQDAQLKNYFGEIIEVYYNEYNLDDRIIYVVKDKEYKLFEFSVNNLLIENIEELNY